MTITAATKSSTGKDESRVLSPAQRLGLAGKPRAEAEKCLADAVYFEARGEVMKGQQAVAQVVMNRVFSGYYPHDVCGVVYQNAGRHLACQFTFACEGKDLNKIDEPDMWEQAKQIANDMLDGKIWLAEVGHATHYHAYWVHPSWVHEMTRLYQLGVHTFYRPRNWGDGDDEPVLGRSAGDDREHQSRQPAASAARSRGAVGKSPAESAATGSERERPGSLSVACSAADKTRADGEAVTHAIDGRGTRSHLDIQPDVEILHRVRERAGGQIIDAGFRDRRGALERDTAGGFDDEAAGDHGDGLAHRFEIEIVDQHHIGKPDIEHLLQLVERVDFDLDLDQMTGGLLARGRARL